mgnify:CR=1 FL=1
MEIWKDIDGFNGVYRVSNEGRVYSNLSGKILKQLPRRHGYLSVWLYGNGGICGRNGKAYSVHRLVADAFCEKSEGANEVNHINENKMDNRAENLEWCTHRENSRHGTRGKRISEGNTNGKRAKPVYAYDKVTGECVKSYPSMGEIKRTTSYSVGNISSVIAGKKKTAYGYVWTH